MKIEKWLTAKAPSEKAVYFRKVFSAKDCKRAKLTVSALGWCKIFVNGQAVTNEEFLPGWTDYTKRVLLFSYDITRLIRQQNVIGAAVGKGWAMGTILFGELNKYYQIPAPCLYARVEWEDARGNVFVEEYDGWKFGYGPIIENDIMMGETQDLYRECKGLFQVGADERGFEDAAFFERALETEEKILPRVSAHESFAGVPLCNGVYDFKQNFSGVVKLFVRSFSRAVVTVRHGEILDGNGSVYTGNLRTAKATDRYILPKGEYVLRPWFTYHGFRYAEIAVEGNAEIVSCEGVAIYTDAPQIGSFSTSSALVNQIASNCLWGLKSNLHYIPTDCPQRDERLGWLGDAGVIARSSLYQFDCKDLWLHYLSVIAEATREDGAIPCIAPNTKEFLSDAIGASGWADAFLSILSDYYDFYADKALIEKYFPIADAFIEWLEKNSENYRRNTYCFSDWLSIHADLTEGYGDVDFTLFDLSFYALDCLFMQRFCDILGRDKTKYAEKYERAKAFFLRNLYRDGEIVGGGRQTALLLAYKAGFLSEEQICKPLVDDIERNGMTSGFIGVKYLLPVLTELGRADLAYRLITNDNYPSWGYTVRCGATTLWERWDSYTKEKGVNPHGMNSFNHFAFGSCAEWFYGDVLGIKTNGNERLVIAPTPDWTGKIRRAQGAWSFRGGKVEVRWEVDGTGRGAKARVWVCAPENAVEKYRFDGWTLLRADDSGGGKEFLLEK